MIFTAGESFPLPFAKTILLIQLHMYTSNTKDVPSFYSNKRNLKKPLIICNGTKFQFRWYNHCFRGNNVVLSEIRLTLQSKPFFSYSILEIIQKPNPANFNPKMSVIIKWPRTWFRLIESGKDYVARDWTGFGLVKGLSWFWSFISVMGVWQIDRSILRSNLINENDVFYATKLKHQAYERVSMQCVTQVKVHSPVWLL